MTRTGTIPTGELEWIRIHFNTQKRRSNAAGLQALLRETGGDALCNGSIFLRDGSPCCHLKADGVVKCIPEYKVWAVSWTDPADFGVKVVPNGDKNYMECVQLIVRGEKEAAPHYGADMGYSAYRTAVGVKDGRFAYYVSRVRMRPEQLRDVLFSAGWSDAVMMDGGGSACYMDRDGSGLPGDGRVIPFFLVWKRKSGAVSAPETKKEGAGLRTVSAYSKKTEGSVKLSANFKVSEFACKDGTDPVFVAPALVGVLQHIRDYFGAAVTINSGYRTPSYNTKVGGAAASQHCLGTAADIVVKGKTPADVGAYARKLMPNYGGVGIYRKSGFVHVDVREKKTDWEG